MSHRVPVIDISHLGEEGPREEEAVARVARAAQHWGFFQIINHGVPQSLIDRVWEATRRFFALPRDAKLEISRTHANARGYYDRELTKNKRDLKEVFDFGTLDAPPPATATGQMTSAIDGVNQWPAQIPTFRATMQEYFAACETLGFKLLEALCMGLDRPRDSLHRHFRPEHTSFIRLNYYPVDDPLDPKSAATVTPLGDMALHHHTDAGALTILLQDSTGGLQVERNGAWSDVEPRSDAFVVNIADMMQVWSNDRYQAALHRVLPRTERRERFSIPFFFNPSYSTDCAPLTIPAGDSARYRVINWGRFRKARADGDYADFGKEIQIADFRL